MIPACLRSIPVFYDLGRLGDTLFEGDLHKALHGSGVGELKGLPPYGDEDMVMVVYIVDGMTKVIAVDSPYQGEALVSALTDRYELSKSKFDIWWYLGWGVKNRVNSVSPQSLYELLGL